MFFLKLGKVQQVVYQCLLITAPILSFFANTMECFKQATIYENRELLLTEKMKKVKKIEEIDQTALTKEAVALTKKHFGSSQESPYFSLPDKNSTLYELAIASRLALFQQNELSAIIIPTLPHPTHDSLQSGVDFSDSYSYLLLFFLCFLCCSLLYSNYILSNNFNSFFLH